MCMLGNTKRQNGCSGIEFLIKIHHTTGAKKKFIFLCIPAEDRIPKHTIQTYERLIIKK